MHNKLCFWEKNITLKKRKRFYRWSILFFHDVLKYENVKTKHLVHILFKIKMKAKTYGIKF